MQPILPGSAWPADSSVGASATSTHSPPQTSTNAGGPSGPFHPAPSDPQSPEEAVVMLLMQAGRRLRSRHPEDAVEPSTFPVAKQLMCSDAMRVSDLAARLGLDASTVSRQIKQLEDKGIIERTSDPADGRASLVQISAAGREVMQSAFRRRFDRIKAALEPWTDDERQQLQDVLTRLVRDLADAIDRDATDVDGAQPPGVVPPHSQHSHTPNEREVSS